MASKAMVNKTINAKTANGSLLATMP